MSKLRQFGSSLLALSVLTAAGLGVVVGQPAAKTYTKHKAKTLIATGDADRSNNPARAQGNYRVASLLDPGSDAAEKASELFLQNDQPDDAVESLRGAQPINYLRIAEIQYNSRNFSASLKSLMLIENFNTKAEILKIKNLLELDQTSEALKIAQASASQDPSIGLLLGLTQLIAAKSSDASSTVASLTAPEAVQALKRASSDNVSLAKVLYAQALLRSSERIIKTQLDTSEAYLLLAQIKLASSNPSRGELGEAKTALQKAEQIDPGNLSVHQLIKAVYDQIGDSANADLENSLILQLTSGRI